MKRPIILHQVIFIFLLVPVIGFSQSKKLVRQGKRVLDLKKKITLFTDAIALDDNNLDAYFYRGLAKANLEDYLGAVLDFSTVIFKKPDADSFYNRGNSKFALGDFKGAYQDYLMSLDYDRDFFPAFYNLGITQLQLEKYDEALHSFNFLFKHFPDDVNTNIQMGLTLTELKQHKLAILFLNKSIKLESNTDTYHNRGIAYLDMKAYKKAEADFVKAINLDKTNDSAYYYLGVSQLFSRNFPKAIHSFKKTMSFNSLDYEALVGLAIAYYHTNNFGEAKTCFKKARNILASQQTYHKYIDDIALFENNSWNTNEGQIFKAYFDRLNAL
ncbi:hypothetical protein MHTCC0001_11160 [Flavobacteriaceae bacterium MHTCC 0001]